MKEVSTLTTKKEKGITVSYSAFYVAALCYLMIPVMIFILGWIRALIAVPAVLILGAAVFFSVRDFLKDPEGKALSSDTAFKFSPVFLIAVAIFSLAIAYFSNIGEFVWGTTDHAFRKAILNDLIEYRWPVIYDLSKQSVPEVNNMLPDTPVFFSYYLSFWMIPAAAGKVLGFTFANILLYIWSVLGIIMILTGMAMVIKRQSYAVIFSFLFFSGFDFIPYLYFQAKGPESWMWLEGWTEHIVYISNANNLINVFNQCIPCWLIVILLMMARNNRSLGLTGALMFPYSPWATIGLLPIAVYLLFKKEFSAKETKKKVLNICSFTNIAAPAVFVLLFVPLYLSNSNATSVSGFTWSFYGDPLKFLIAFVMTFVIEVLPAFILVFKDNRKNGLFWVVVIALAVMPIYKISGQNDFTMRGSMPEFFVLTVLLASTIARVMNEKKNEKSGGDLKSSLKTVGAFLMLLTMMAVAFQMYLLIVVSTFDGTPRANDDIGSFGDIKTASYVQTIDEQFYVYDYEDSAFFKYLARR